MQAGGQAGSLGRRLVSWCSSTCGRALRKEACAREKKQGRDDGPYEGAEGAGSKTACLGLEQTNGSVGLLLLWCKMGLF